MLAVGAEQDKSVSSSYRNHIETNLFILNIAFLSKMSLSKHALQLIATLIKTQDSQS